MVPTWGLALAFAAGLAAGVMVCRLVMGRGRSTEPVAPVAVPETAQPAAASIEAEQEPQPAAAAAVTSAVSDETAASVDPAATVDNVVAELERRVKGRRPDGDANRSTGRGGSGRRKSG